MNSRAEEKDHSIELFVARKIAVDRGESAPHPQILVLSRNERDIEVARQALAETPFEVVEATGILDLGYRLRTCTADGILISIEQRELSAIEVLSLIRQSPWMESMPLFLYGGDSLQDQALSMGVTLCLHDLSHACEILPHLPERAKPAAKAGDPAAAPEAPVGAPAGVLAEQPAPDGAADDGEITFEE